MSHSIIQVTIEEGGRVDVRVQGSEMSVAQYGHIIGTVVRIAADMFVDASGLPQKDVVSEILKGVNRFAHDRAPIAAYKTTLQ